MSNTLVISYFGQSNGVGKNSSTGGAGNGAPFYTTTNTGIRILKYDGHLSGNNWSSTCSDPWADPTNAIDGGNHALRAGIDPLSSLGTCSALPFADALKTSGRTENMILVPNCLAQTGVLSDWTDSGGYASVPSYSTLFGSFLHRTSHAMRQAPNSRLLVVWCGGENEAIDGSGTHPDTTLATNLGALLDAINTWGTAEGWTWDKSKHFLLYQISAGYGGAPLSWPRTTQTRAALTTVGGRSDVLLCTTDPFAGTWIHLNKAEQIARANAGAPLYLAAA